MRKKDIERAIGLLASYNGSNPYILRLKRNAASVDEFGAEYLLSNYDSEPIEIGRMTEVADWFAEKNKVKWGTEFLPTKLLIKKLYGTTDVFYHCLVQYRKSAEPVPCFIPKKAVVRDFLHGDFNDYSVDFGRYDRLSARIDSNRKIREHQKEAVRFLLSRKKCILANDMGTGKSMALSVAAVEGNFDSVLIICPASLKTNWKKELLYFVSERDITIVDSFLSMKKGELESFLGYKEGKSGLKKEELVKEAKENGKWQDNRIVIVNFDILDEFFNMGRGMKEEERIANSPLLKYIYGRKSLIVIDEAHRLSNMSSNRYKIIRGLIKKGNPDSVYLSTGTPVTNNPQNLFCLLQLIGEPIADDYDYYTKRYCDATMIPAKGERDRLTSIFLNRKNKRTWYDLDRKEKDELKEYIDKYAKKIRIATGNSNLDELQRCISHIYLRRTKDEVMDGSIEKRVHEVFYDLSHAQRMEYGRLWDEYEEERKNINPDGELNRDLLEGAVYRKYISDIMVPNTIRLCDSFLEGGEKVIIACCYDDELYALRDHYGDRCVVYNGKMNGKQKDAAVESFMHDDGVTVFIGNIVAAGVGINLTVASKLIFNNISYVPSDDHQFEDRIYRIGQKKDCDIYYQIFRDTQYEKMWDTVLKKELVIDQIIKQEDEK